MNAFLPLLRASASTLLLSLSAASAFAAPVQVDPQALSLLQKVQTTMQNTQSLTAISAEVTNYHNPEHEMHWGGTVKLLKPNYAYEQEWDLRKSKATGAWEKGNMFTVLSSDGKDAWEVLLSGEYRKDKADAKGRNIGFFALPTFDFFDTSQSVLAQVHEQQKKGQLIALSYVGTEAWEGRSYQLIDWDFNADNPIETGSAKKVPNIFTEHNRLYIGSDNLVHRLVYAYSIGWSGEQALRNVRVNAPLTSASFKFTLPPGAHLPTPPPALLAAGTLAPDFAAIAPDGSPVHLSDYQGKIVVLDFWSTWCGPCQRSMPHLEKVYQSVKDKNVAVLGICVWDKKTEYDKWVTANKDTYHFPTAFDPAATQEESIASKLYHVSGIPTQYVIDKDGKITASTVGYDEKGTVLEDTLKKLGADTVAAAKP